MRIFPLFFSAIFLLITSCEKDNNGNDNNNPVTSGDVRAKFVGTWKGSYKFTLTGLPPSFPTEFPTTVDISKSQTSSSEIELTINNTQPAYAVVTNNEYLYRPFSFNNATLRINLTLNGTGKLSSDGKSISESGTASGSFTVPPSTDPVPLSGTWTSVLTK